jgi:hypothetical protein
LREPLSWIEKKARKRLYTEGVSCVELQVHAQAGCSLCQIVITAVQIALRENALERELQNTTVMRYIGYEVKDCAFFALTIEKDFRPVTGYCFEINCKPGA